VFHCVAKISFDPTRCSSRQFLLRRKDRPQASSSIFPRSIAEQTQVHDGSSVARQRPAMEHDELEINCGYCGKRIVVKISEIRAQRIPRGVQRELWSEL